jgi:4-carboxymuconolactone decarboxylase
MAESESERIERGRAFINKINRTDVNVLIDRLRPVSPDFERLMLGDDIADIWDRDQISLRERLIVRLGVAAAMAGTDPTTEGMIDTALNVGISPEDIGEMFLQALPQVGYIRLIAALEALQRALDARQTETATA